MGVSAAFVMSLRLCERPRPSPDAFLFFPFEILLHESLAVDYRYESYWQNGTVALSSTDALYNIGGGQWHHGSWAIGFGVAGTEMRGLKQGWESNIYLEVDLHSDCIFWVKGFRMNRVHAVGTSFHDQVFSIVGTVF